MDANQFCYWLNGFAELTNGIPPTPEQWKSIVEHLGLVFHKVTPSVGPGFTPKEPINKPDWWPSDQPGYPKWNEPLNPFPYKVIC